MNMYRTYRGEYYHADNATNPDDDCISHDDPWWNDPASAIDPDMLYDVLRPLYIAYVSNPAERDISRTYYEPKLGYVRETITIVGTFQPVIIHRNETTVFHDGDIPHTTRHIYIDARLKTRLEVYTSIFDANGVTYTTFDSDYHSEVMRRWRGVI